MPEEENRTESQPLPSRTIQTLTRPFVRFLHFEAASGGVLLACTAVALVLANSPLSASYLAFWDQTARLGVGRFELAYPLWYWVNDGLMTLFFFVIGLEIKRELVHGELQELRKILVPVAAALGGAVTPILVFFALRPGAEGRSAWAVPMATDIAFVVGCLALLGARVPHGLKILMLSLAIVDDILAVLVIAAFYTETIRLAWLAGALAGFGVTTALNRLGVRSVSAYVLVGAGIWLCTLKSGIHPTVAGVALGLLTPAAAWLGHGSLIDVLEGTLVRLRSGGRSREAANERREALGEAVFAGREALSPLERIEEGMHPWVAFLIMPIFALCNAGVAITVHTLTAPLALAIAVGLVLGKPIGILLGTWGVTKTGLGQLPDGTTWPMIVGAGCLGGIGFTMSLFVASLGLQGDALAVAKGGVLLGSAVSLLTGLGLLGWVLKSKGVGSAPKRAAPTEGPSQSESDPSGMARRPLSSPLDSDG